jgi:anti-anti-sigma regulatory factor
MMTSSPPQAPPLPAVHADASGWAVVTLSGEQNAHTSDLVRTALIEADTLGTGRVIVDLTKATATGSVLLAHCAGPRGIPTARCA